MRAGISDLILAFYFDEHIGSALPKIKNKKGW